MAESIKTNYQRGDNQGSDKRHAHEWKQSEIVYILNDAIVLVTDGSHELDLRRRSLLKVQLKPEYKSLLSESSSVPVCQSFCFQQNWKNQLMTLRNLTKLLLPLLLAGSDYIIIPNYSTTAIDLKNLQKQCWPFIGHQIHILY